MIARSTSQNDPAWTVSCDSESLTDDTIRAMAALLLDSVEKKEDEQVCCLGAIDTAGAETG